MMLSIISAICFGLVPLFTKIVLSMNYDVIAIGTPTWWYTMAPAVLTFLHQQDWNGKIVVPFQTHAGWPGHVLKNVAGACVGAEIVCGMQVKFDSNGGDHLDTKETEIEAWAQKVKALL